MRCEGQKFLIFMNLTDGFFPPLMDPVFGTEIKDIGENTSLAPKGSKFPLYFLLETFVVWGLYLSS